jgi:hypothetical protein
MHEGMTIHGLNARVQRVLHLDCDYESRLAEVDAAFAQVQRDLLTARTPQRFAALSILEFSLLCESAKLRVGRQ